jgi:hypothetical protein
MRRFIAPLVLLSATALGWQLGGATRFSPDSAEAREAVRLRSHFASVEREMLHRDLSGLTLAQRVARAELLALLRRYSEEGAFPRNDFHPGRMVPYFRDARGNLCAMAFLIAATGRGDIVDHVARTRNNAYVPELADEPGLAGWLIEHGITLDEAARIQPSYDDGTCCLLPDDPPRVPNPSAGYLMISAGGNALSAVSIAMNARSAERLSTGRGWGIAGLGVGAATMALGALKVGKGSADNQVVGAWNLAVGATAAFFGGRALSKRKAVTQKAAERLRITPVALAGHRPGLGIVGRLQF